MSVLSVIKPSYVSHVFVFVSMGCLCVSDGDISTNDHSTHLHATGQTEDTLAYNDNGVAWEDAIQSDIDVETGNA